MSWQASQEDLESLLDKLSQRTKLSLDYKSWRASVVSTITKMDKSWNPEEVLLVSKNIGSSDEGEPREEILKAQQTKKGKTTDVTQKYAEEGRKEREKARKRRAEEQTKTSADEKHGGGAMSLDEFLPFSKSKRKDFEFRLQNPPASEGPAVAVLETRAKVKGPRNWEGTFSFNPETFDLISLELRPSQNPKMVKELAMRIDFEVLQFRYLVLKRTQFKVNGGIFIKHVRQIVEDVYSDFEVLDKQN
ncbi:MAG: hypothetical protein A2W03_12155 [Candidatus Aminicenantes bacterium RBG_16_63_16]|nr:MAG: hypothetical protein A2W03_12155 [Candidatus Aminicenantes bacterium RBG_16_63_16]